MLGKWWQVLPILIGFIVGCSLVDHVGFPPETVLAVAKSLLHFYEKVIKVKADVAALHIFSSDIDDAASGGVEICQGRRF